MVQVKSRRIAENLGLDDEILRAKDSFLIASEEPPGSRRPARQARTSLERAAGIQTSPPLTVSLLRRRSIKRIIAT